MSVGGVDAVRACTVIPVTTPLESEVWRRRIQGGITVRSLKPGIGLQRRQNQNSHYSLLSTAIFLSNFGIPLLVLLTINWDGSLSTWFIRKRGQRCTHWIELKYKMPICLRRTLDFWDRYMYEACQFVLMWLLSISQLANCPPKMANTSIKTCDANLNCKWFMEFLTLARVRASIDSMRPIHWLAPDTRTN